jgi:alpha/beta superfamily hydrolase
LIRAESRRVDRDAGIVEEADFFGAGSDRVFGITYLPDAAPPMAGVVMCDPILAQFRAHYRIGTMTARAIAGRGIAVQRFHYRGMGNSDGHISEMSLSSMAEDASRAAAHLKGHTGAVPIVYHGVNVGAYPAATVSQPDQMLVLDSPPPNGRQYLRNAVRAHGVYTMKTDSGGLTMDGLHAELRGGSPDVALLGCRLSLALYESLVESDLIGEIGGVPRPILMFGLGADGAFKPDGERLRTDLVGKGFPVEVSVRDKVDPFWYVENAAPEDQPDAIDTADRISDWIQRSIAGTVESQVNGYA